MKTKKYIYLVIFFFACNATDAQYMVPSTSTIRTPYGNISHTTYRYMPMNYGGGSVSAKYEFSVVMKNDSTFMSKTKIDISGKVHTIKAKSKKQKMVISPKETKEIYRITYSGKKLAGIPADSCWLFQCGKGKINTYASVAEEGTGYAIAIQSQDDGPIVPLTKNNLEAMVGTPENPKVLKLIEKRKFVNAIDLYNGETK